MVLVLLTSLELLHVYNPSRTLRSSPDTRMLKIQQYKYKTHGFCSLSLFLWTPHLEFTSHKTLDTAQILSSFLKAKLKTFLFLLYFPSQLISVPSLCYMPLSCVWVGGEGVCVCIFILPHVNYFGIAVF